MIFSRVSVQFKDSMNFHLPCYCYFVIVAVVADREREREREPRLVMIYDYDCRLSNNLANFN